MSASVLWKFLVHDDPPVFDGDVAAVGEIGDDAADHFARGADARSDFLLGQAFGSEAPIFALGGLFLDELQQAAIHTQERQVVHAIRKVAHFAKQAPDQIARKIGMVLDQRLDLGLGDDEEAACLQGHDGRGTRPTIQRDLTKIVAGVDHAQYELLSVLVADEDLDPARQDDVERVGNIAGMNDDAALGVRSYRTQWDHFFQHAFVEIQEGDKVLLHHHGAIFFMNLGGFLPGTLGAA